MAVVLLGINHKTASIEVRERFAFSLAELPAALSAFKQEYGNGAIISTCNRTELYVVGKRGRPGRSELLGFLGRLKGENAEERRDRFYFATHTRAVSHLFRVAAGLESMVLGEAPILGQGRNAYAASASAGVSGPLLHPRLPAPPGGGPGSGGRTGEARPPHPPSSPAPSANPTSSSALRARPPSSSTSR